VTKKVNKSTDVGADAKIVNEAIAHQIKTYRKQQKLSLDELSRRAGVSKGMLVEIEKCEANPSIALLCKLSAALGLSVADIVNVTGTPNIHLIQKEEIVTLWTGEEGGSACFLAGTSGPGTVELWRWTMYPGEVFFSPGHSQGTSELLHVEQGTLEVKAGETVVSIPEGCSVVAKMDEPHHYANVSDAVVIFTMTVAER
jgi:transcriptional regulator with XRE-family HTH domain